MRPLFFFACLTACLLTASANAQCVVQPRTTFVQTSHVATPVVAVTPVLAATFINTVPSYSVGYQAGYGGGYGGDEVGKAILEELKALRAETQAMRAALGAGGATKAFAPTAIHPGLSVLRNSCAKCHDANVAAVKGGKNVFFKDGEFIDEGDNVSRCIQAIDDGSMPRGSKMSADEKYQALKYWTVRQADPGVTPMPDAKKK